MARSKKQINRISEKVATSSKPFRVYKKIPKHFYREVPRSARPIQVSKLSLPLRRDINRHAQRAARGFIRSQSYLRRLGYVAGRIVGDPSRIFDHDCRREYRQLLSWRASRVKSSGGASSKRKRSKKELNQNRKDFFSKDC